MSPLLLLRGWERKKYIYSSRDIDTPGVVSFRGFIFLNRIFGCVPGVVTTQECHVECGDNKVAIDGRIGPTHPADTLAENACDRA